jgi:hypothetical protein
MKYKINLLSKRLNKQSFLKKLNYFTYNYLRYILVITQLVVMSVLFFRFSIDQRIIDLKDEIYQQEEILKSVRPIIVESEIVDFKIKSLKQLISNQDKFKKQIEYILSIFPASAFLSKFSIADTSTVLQGNVLDPNHLQAFYNRLKKEKRYKEVNLGSIKRSEKGFSFMLTLNNFK